MDQQLVNRLRQHIAARSLLSHPFYQDWKQGKLTIEDLRAYAGQYYRFEAEFPRFLSTIHSRCPDGQVRQDILANLWDEEHGDRNHRVMWLDFCAGTGLSAADAEASPIHLRTRALLDTYTDICSTRSFQEGLAAIYAYEFQVPEVAAEKLDGLTNLYRITDPTALDFFRVHSELDVEHSRLEEEAIIRHTTANDEPAVEAALVAALDAWWGFLDGVNELRGAKVAHASQA